MVGALWGVVGVLGMEFYVEYVVVAGVFCYSSLGEEGDDHFVESMLADFFIWYRRSARSML